jgi:two-component system copper resistance phosphate regulon response regulator CusR
MLLSLAGFRVEVAGSGAEGLALALQGGHDLIAVDVRLPDVLGLTVLQRLKAAGVVAPIVVITGWYGEPEIARLARTLGAAAFLIKPFLDGSTSWPRRCARS